MAHFIVLRENHLQTPRKPLYRHNRRFRAASFQVLPGLEIFRAGLTPGSLLYRAPTKPPTKL